MNRLTRKIRKIARQEVRKDQEKAVALIQVPFDVTYSSGQYQAWIPIDPYCSNVLDSSVQSKQERLNVTRWGFPTNVKNYETGYPPFNCMQGGKIQRLSHSCRILMGYQLSVGGTPYDNTVAPIGTNIIFGPTIVRFQYIMAAKGITDDQLLSYLSGLPLLKNIWDPDFAHFILDYDFVHVIKTYDFQIGINLRNIDTTMTLPNSPLEKQAFQPAVDDQGKVIDWWQTQRKIYLFMQIIPGGQFTYTSPDPDQTLRILPRFKLLIHNTYDTE